MTIRNDTETDTRTPTKATFEVLGLRAKGYAYSVVQYTGWLVLFYGIHQLAKPFLLVQGYDITLPEFIASVAPALPFLEAIAAMVAGMVIVWISTASWF